MLESIAPGSTSENLLPDAHERSSTLRMEKSHATTREVFGLYLPEVPVPTLELVAEAAERPRYRPPTQCTRGEQRYPGEIRVSLGKLCMSPPWPGLARGHSMLSVKA